MEKEKLQERLKLIEEAIKKLNGQLNQTMADLNVLEGGRQEVSFWLQEIDKPE